MSMFTSTQIPFTNKSVTFEEWKTLKPKTPHGTLPMLEIEDNNKVVSTVSQATAILRYLGKRSGLSPAGESPEDQLVAMEIDSTMDFIEDALRLVVPTVTGPEKALLQNSPSSMEKRLPSESELLKILKMVGHL